MNSDSLTININSREERSAISLRLCELFDKRSCELNRLSWDDLESIPCWFVMEKEDRSYLQALCGVAYLAPVLIDCTNSKSLKKITTLISKDHLLNTFDWYEEKIENLPSTEIAAVKEGIASFSYDHIDKTIKAAGSAVLMSAINNARIIPLALELHGIPAGKMKHSQACEITNKAISMMQHALDGPVAA